MATVMPEAQISASLDDAYVFNGVFANANQLILASNALHTRTGMRWQNIPIPQGATIVSATLEVHEFDTRKTFSTLVYGDDEDNASAFSDVADMAARPLTSNVSLALQPVPWSGWGTVRFTTSGAIPNALLPAVIEQIVNRPGWSSGNALALIWVHQSTSLGRCRSYDFAGNAHGAKLNVTYIGGGGQIVALNIV